MAEFGPALRRVLGYEGVRFDDKGNVTSTGYFDHPSDRGGETIYGITNGVAREAGWEGPLVRMPLSFAREIYRVKYWDKIMGDAMADQEIAEKMFCMGVNMGPGAPVRFLQRGLNVLNGKGTRWPDITVDGLMGPKTLETVGLALAQHPANKSCILTILRGLQISRYVEISENNESQEDFTRGWLSRVND